MFVLMLGFVLCFSHLHVWFKLPTWTRIHNSDVGAQGVNSAVFKALVKLGGAGRTEHCCSGYALDRYGTNGLISIQADGCSRATRVVLLGQ